MPAFDPLNFDPLSADFAADPYAVYQDMRDVGAPVYIPEMDMWMLSRYADVAKVATNPKMLRSLDGIEDPKDAAERQIKANWHEMPYHERVVQFSLLDSDGAIHRRLRKQIFGNFTNSAVVGLEPVVQGFVDDLLMRLNGQQEFDFIEDFAAHVPGLVIGHILGAPAKDAVQLRQWSENVVQYFDVDRSAARKETAETATREFYEYLTALKAERLENPRDDLITKMIADQAAGLYSEDEFISTCMLILMAGHGSTIDVLGSGMHTLLKNPDAMQTLRDNPDAMPTAIQEMFRFEPPLPFFHRHATDSIEVGGQVFPAGTTFGLLYGAANRDPDKFENPDQFQIDRNPNRHLAFGIGAHLCLGNNVARLTMKVIFETMLQRFKTISLVDRHVKYKAGLSVRGPIALQIKLAAA